MSGHIHVHAVGSAIGLLASLFAIASGALVIRASRQSKKFVIVPKVWPGALAIWAAIVLHLGWAVLLLWPNSHAGNSTPVHEVVMVAGSQARAGVVFLAVAAIALLGTFSVTALGKICFVLPQQLVLGVSAAGASVAMYQAQYADGVARPASFIIADQLPIVLTWVFHTAAIVLLFLIHQRRLSPGGHSLVEHHAG